MSEPQTTWNGRPPQDNPAGWHLLRRQAKGFPRDGEEVPWLYTPGMSYRPTELTPWTNPDRGCADEAYIAWNWEYVGRLALEVATVGEEARSSSEIVRMAERIR
jgi:hypothetical protein